MKKIIFLSFLAFFLYTPLNYAQTQQLELTTYYAAPTGNYDRLRLVPRAALSGACDIGTFYVNATNNLPFFCANNGGTGAWTLIPSPWSENSAGTAVYLTRAGASFPSVGLGTTVPRAALDIRSPAGIGKSSLRFEMSGADTNWEIGSVTSDSFNIIGGLNGSEINQLTITPSNLMSIGPGTPLTRLHVFGDTTVESTAPTINLTDTDESNFQIKADSNRLSFNFENSGVYKQGLTITDQGFVGIGDSFTPLTELHLADEDGATITISHIDGGIDVPIGGILFTIGGNPSSSIISSNRSSTGNTVSINTLLGEHLTVTDNGRVGIGNIDPQPNSMWPGVPPKFAVDGYIQTRNPNPLPSGPDAYRYPLVADLPIRVIGGITNGITYCDCEGVATAIRSGNQLVITFSRALTAPPKSVVATMQNHQADPGKVYIVTIAGKSDSDVTFRMFDITAGVPSPAIPVTDPPSVHFHIIGVQ